MSIKDLFKDTKQVANEKPEEIYNEVESRTFIQKKNEENQEFIPNLDFSDPKSFARFGLADEYYSSAIQHIYSSYPYDGSESEITDWRNKLTYLEKYVFDSEYPKTTGFITLNSDTYDSAYTSVGSGDTKVLVSNNAQYVKAYSGPNAKGNLYKDGNIYNVNNNQEANFGLSSQKGNTVEFWFKLEEGLSQNVLSSSFGLFDLWNGIEDTNSSNYARLSIGLLASQKKFTITYKGNTDPLSGYGALQNVSIDYNLTDLNSWHHYAFSFVNREENDGTLIAKLYIDGELVWKSDGEYASALSFDNKNLLANLGSYRFYSAGNYNLGAAPGSFDEFRFWKTEKTQKDIKRYLFDRVYGGSNTDLSNTDLGVYYRFNEGVLNEESIDQRDSIILDYSGRVSNGTIVNYTAGVRSTSSAIDDSGLFESQEVKDPILYPDHYLVINKSSELKEKGQEWDLRNGNSIYRSLPEWITTEDEEVATEELKKVTQIIASYFDKIYLQIKELPTFGFGEYYEQDRKPAPFINSILESNGFLAPDIFVDSKIIEDLKSRDEQRLFEEKLTDLKNLIYKNILNNLTYIYKTKGTEKSFRNLIRSFGIDDELIKLNIYANNTEFTIENNKKSIVEKKKVLNFSTPDSYGTNIFNTNETSDSTTSYSSLLPTINLDTAKVPYYLIPLTFETEIFFPKKLETSDVNYSVPEETNISLFGGYSINNLTDEANIVTSHYNFETFLVKNKKDDRGGYFKFNCIATADNNLRSQYFSDIYEGEKWNFAVRLKTPYDNLDKLNYDINAFNTLPVGKDYYLEFYGVNTVEGNIKNEFTVTSSALTLEQVQNIHGDFKKFYVGARKNNFTGSVLNYTDILVSNARFWYDYLSNEEIKEHAKDSANFGVKNPIAKPYENLDEKIERINLLAFNWDFDEVTSSDSNGEVLVKDTKGAVSGLDSLFSYNVEKTYAAKASETLANSKDIVKKHYTLASKQTVPENLYTSDTINIYGDSDYAFTKDTKPVSLFWAFEKSMYQTISEEMLNMFAGIVDFNNLIGDPINKYRQEYRDLNALRRKFFEKVENEPSVEKYIEFYKWIDSAIGEMLYQLAPAGSEFSQNIRNMIESHVLERPKYDYKLPQVKKTTVDYAQAKGIKELKYNWKKGHAPEDLTSFSQEDSALWLKERAERINSPVIVSSGDADADKQKLLDSIVNETNKKKYKSYNAATSTVYEKTAYYDRRLARLYDLAADKPYSLVDGIETFAVVNVLNSLTNSVELRPLFADSGSARTSLFNQPRANYSKQYNIVQAAGREINNKHLVDVEGVLSSATASAFISGAYDYPLPTRKKYEGIMVNRFSAPGGPESLSRGALDRESETFSVYNTVNYRNPLVRKALNDWMRETASIDSNNPSFHKINKNHLKTANSNEYDNGFVSHQIPRSDYGYAWISASATNLITSSGPYSSIYPNTDIGTLAVLSASTESGEVIDFVGLNNSNITTSVNQDTSTISFNENGSLHKYLLKKDGPFGYTSWKQIRQKDNNKLANLLFKNNKFIIQKNTSNFVTETRTYAADSVSPPLTKPSKLEVKSITKPYIEPPVEWNLPITFGVTLNTELTKINDVYTILRTEYSNVLDTIANQLLKNEIAPVQPDRNKTSYKKIYNLLTSKVQDIDEPVAAGIAYSELVFPRKDKIGLGDIRTKPNYEDNGSTDSIVKTKTFWRDSAVDRERPSSTVDMFGFATSSYNTIGSKLFSSYGSYDNFIFDPNNKLKNSIFAQDLQYSESYSLQNNIDNIKLPVNNIFSFNKDTNIVTNFGAYTGIFASNINTSLSTSDGIYIGGDFTNAGGNSKANCILKWDGQRVTTFKNGINVTDAVVYSIVSGADGLYVGGKFSNLDSTTSKNAIIKWDGTDWVSLGTGSSAGSAPLSPNGSKTIVYSMVSSSQGLYVGGVFTDAGGVSNADTIALWNGSTWTNVGTGSPGSPPLADPDWSSLYSSATVFSLASSSYGLYVGGAFAIAASNNLNAKNIAVWNGTNWTAFGNTIGDGVGGNSYYDRVASISSGSDGIYVGGSFSIASPLTGSDSVSNVAKWDTILSKWKGFGSVLSTVTYNALDKSATFVNSGINSLFSSSDGVYIGGLFSKVGNFGNTSYKNIGLAKWDGASWGTIGGSIYLPLNSYSVINTITSGSSGIIFGGSVTQFVPDKLQKIFYEKNTSGYLSNKDILLEKYFDLEQIYYPIKNVAILDTNQYGNGNIYSLYGTTQDYTNNLDRDILCLVSGSDGVYAGLRAVNDYNSIGNLTGFLKKWTKENDWVTIGNITPSTFGDSVFALCSSSAGVYVGGKFTNGGGVSGAKNLVLCKSSGSFQIVGPTNSFNNQISSIISASEGIYVGGKFTNAAGIAAADGIARWDGTSWNSLGTGSFGLGSGVFCMLSSSEGIYVGGGFTDTGISDTANIARWDGVKWNSVGGSSPSRPNNTVITMASASDGLYVYGADGYTIGNAGNAVTSPFIKKWNGTSWSDISKTLNGLIWSFTALNNKIYAAGNFTSASDGTILNNIACWDGTNWNQVGTNGIRNGFNLTTDDEIYSLVSDGNKIFIGGRFAGTRSGPTIKTKDFKYQFEAYSASVDIVMPKPQLIFNNFIPPNANSNLKIAENTYATNTDLTTTVYSSSNNSIFVLNQGYVYETDQKAGRGAFYDSYTKFIEDIKPHSQKYSIVPEYKISNFVESYVKKVNGNFNSILTSDYLTLQGALQESSFNNLSSSTNISQNFDTTFLYDESLPIDNDFKLTINISAIKKLLPYKGFYPSERIEQLSSYFINSFLPLKRTLVSSKNPKEVYYSALSNGTPLNQQVLALLQPLFAPGILLNTIKSSVAVDFPVFITSSVSYDSRTPPVFYGNTGSSLTTNYLFDYINNIQRNYTASNYIDLNPNYRLPFEALIDFDTKIPDDLKVSANNLYYLNPTHYTTDTITGSDFNNIAYPSYNMGTGSLKSFTFLDANYKLAMHNFLAEIPNFFLKGKLTSITSKPENEFAAAIPGTRYYMDVVLEKDGAYKEFITDPYYENLKSDPAKHSEGTFMIPSPDSLYGPPVRYWDSAGSASLLYQKGPYNLYSKLLDTPSYAPYVPPYYYGKAIARISFLASDTKTRAYSLQEIQDSINIEFLNSEAEALFKQRSNFLLNDFSSSYADNYKNSPAYKSMMNLSSSINLTLKSEDLDLSVDVATSKADKGTKSFVPKFKWVIQTKFETPSINFNDADLTDNIGLQFIDGDKSIPGTVKGVYKNLFKGIWTTYGSPVQEGSGIKLYLQESPTGPNTGSLIQMCGFKTDVKPTLGVLGSEKTVSEALVLIPYTYNKNHVDGKKKINQEFAETLPEILGENNILKPNQRGRGPYYFKINRDILKETFGVSFGKESKISFEEIKTIIDNNSSLKNTSIVDTVRQMTRFVLPPHLDWLRNKNIDPFVMYVIPFDIELQQDSNYTDLSDIWQGVMPSKSMESHIENKNISHPFNSDELFHGKRLPKDVKFKVFKIKQKANVNYYELVEDSKESALKRFKFKFTSSEAVPEYSYNWPYDFCSVIEMANATVELKNGKTDINLKSKTAGETFVTQRRVTSNADTSTPVVTNAQETNNTNIGTTQLTTTIANPTLVQTQFVPQINTVSALNGSPTSSLQAINVNSLTPVAQAQIQNINATNLNVTATTSQLINQQNSALKTINSSTAQAAVKNIKASFSRKIKK